MKVPFKQKTRFGCGLYALANLFDSEDFLKLIKEHENQTVYDLTKALYEVAADTEGAPQLCVETLFAVNPAMKTQNRLWDKSLFKFDAELEAESKIDYSLYFRPFLISIAKSKLIGHLILVCQNFHSGLFYVVDSLEDEIEVTDVAGLITKFNIIEVLNLSFAEKRYKIGEPSQTVVLPIKEFAHIIKN